MTEQLLHPENMFNFFLTFFLLSVLIYFLNWISALLSWPANPQRWHKRLGKYGMLIFGLGLVILFATRTGSNLFTSSTLSESPTPTWKTYLNQESGVTFIYPSDMGINPETHFLADLKSENFSDCENYQPHYSFRPTCYRITVNTDAEDTGAISSMANGGATIYNYIGPASLGEILGREYAISLGPEALQGEDPIIEYKGRSVIAKRGDLYYELKFEALGPSISFEENFKEILQSFRFLNNV